MQVKASLDKYRRSAKKIREIVPVIVGKNVSEAVFQLENVCKGYAEDVKKLILSAVANAKNNHNLKEEGLVLKSLIVDEKPVMKRWMPRAHGRAARILKRTSRIEVIIEDLEVNKKENSADLPLKKETKKELGPEKKQVNEIDKDMKKAEKSVDKSAVLKKEVMAEKSFSKVPKIISNAKKVFRRKSF